MSEARRGRIKPEKYEYRRNTPWFSIAYRHHPVKQQRARMLVGRKISDFTFFSSRQNETAAEINIPASTRTADHDERFRP